MSQFNWTYLAPNGGKHNVGIFHGDKTGHVLVYVNSKVTLIDFKVKESKSYSIFIEEELCEINIEKRRIGGYAYSFDINREADTPTNLQRRKEQKKHLKQGMAFLVGLMLVVSVTIAGLSYWNNKEDNKLLTKSSFLEASGQETSAKVFVANPKEATYNFIANGKVYSNKARLEKEAASLENGMPLEDGDEFIIQYSIDHPEYHEIKFNRPTDAQVERYKQRAYLKYLELNPTQNEKIAKGIVEIAWELEKINGLAKIYLQNVSPEENAKFNSDSYQEMLKSSSFEKKLKERKGTVL